MPRPLGTALPPERIGVSIAMVGQRLDMKEVDDAICPLSVMPYDLGHIDLEQNTLHTIDTRFGARL